MIQALVDGELARPSPREEATCPTCGGVVRAKCGAEVVWHWAHKTVADCDPWAERDTLWHSTWQALVPAEQREVTIGRHRADIVTADGRVVEVQHSPLTAEQVAERERFYGPRMIWVFDAVDAFECERLTTRRQSDGMVAFRWRHARRCVAACRATVLLDLGTDDLLHVEALALTNRCDGRGEWIDRHRFGRYLTTGRWVR